jgi:hypothetical protein
MRRSVLALTALAASVAAVNSALTVVATDNLFGSDDALPRPRGTSIPDKNSASLPVLTTEDEEQVRKIALAVSGDVLG